MIIGIGVDTVDLARFEQSLARTPALLARLFAESERGLRLHSLAARFAAKEALIKALGDSHGLGWHDMAVIRDEDRAPFFIRTPALERLLEELGGGRIHLSMTHDAGVATAFVVVEADGGEARAVGDASGGAAGDADQDGAGDAHGLGDASGGAA